MIYNKDISSWDEWIALREQGYTDVDGNFDCSRNKLTSLEGAPETVGGQFYCHDNPLEDDEIMTFYHLKYTIIA